MSAEHVVPIAEEDDCLDDTTPHLRVVDNTGGLEPSLAERARMVRNPDAAYKEARAYHLTDRVVYAVTEYLPPYAKARAEMAYIAIDSFFDKITPKRG